MTRQRSQTIGTLGRAPARKDPAQPSQKIPTAPIEPPPPDKGAVRRWLHGAVFDNVGLKFLSIVLAVTVFLLVNDDKDREITVRVGVGYILPEDKVVVSDRVDEVSVTVRGPWRRLRHFDGRELQRISVDLRNAPTGEILFTNDLIDPPSGLEIVSITPKSMRVVFDKRAERLIEVAPVVAGPPVHGYRVVETKAMPATVKIMGAERLLAALSALKTREVVLEGKTETFQAQVALEVPQGIDVAGSEIVNVEVKLDQELVERKYPDVKVAVRVDGMPANSAAESRWTVIPSQVEITLTGPLLAVEKTREAIVPTVKVLPTDKAAREVPIVIEGVPNGIGVRVSPERVKVSPAK